MQDTGEGRKEKRDDKSSQSSCYVTHCLLTDTVTRWCNAPHGKYSANLEAACAIFFFVSSQSLTFVVRWVQALLLGFHCKRPQCVGKDLVESIPRPLGTRGRYHILVAHWSSGECAIVGARDIDVGSTQCWMVEQIQVLCRCSRGAVEVRVGRVRR